MPRSYKPSANKRYNKHNELVIAVALNDYRTTNNSLADIENKYGVPKSVLQRHNKGIMKKPGGQKALTTEIEDNIVENINCFSEGGDNPLNTVDLRFLIKNYLDSRGIIVKKFNDNLPGPDFVKGFLVRHKGKISESIISRHRIAEVSMSTEMTQEYFVVPSTLSKTVPLKHDSSPEPSVPRTHKPSPNKRYKRHDKHAIAAALKHYKTTNSTLADVGIKYGIPKSVLQRHNKRVMKTHGGQKALTTEIEKHIVEKLNCFSEERYPLNTADVRFLVKGHLDSMGVIVKRFKDNLPGPDFVKGFLLRHKGKIPANIIKKNNKRLETMSPEMIQEYLTCTSAIIEPIDHDDTNSAEKDHNYCTKTFTLESDAEVSSEIDLPTKTGDETAGADNTKIRLEFGPVSDAGEWQKAEEVPAEAGPFSWQKLTEDVDKIEEKQSAVDDVTFSGETQLVPDVSSTLSRTQEGYSCNACHERITGFRYACVQCRDWDLCGACEARGEHDEHYVLRVPPHKTHRETQAVLAALRQMLTNEPDVALVKKEVKTEDPLAEAEVPLEPSLEELTQTDIEDTHQRQETSRTDDTYYYVASGPQKRKMPPHTNIQTSSPKRPKRIIQISVCPKRDCLDGAPIRQYPEIVKKRQCLDSAQKSYVSTSAVTKKNSSISTESPIEKNGSQIETGQVILLDDIDTTGEIVLASNSQVGHDVGLLELPSSSTSDKCMVLKVVGSQELRVNMTQLNDEEIMSATQPRQAKGER